MTNTIYWHDYETFGADPRRDRASQFAGVRTDEQLNIVGDPLVMYCKPAPDMVPHPEACLITGITPQKALAEGVHEVEFIRRIHEEFARPLTCVAGYNSLRFDDEMTRQLLYRNFYDPYEREWKNGNSRWDIIDMVRLCCALRPEGINWPQKEDGSPSFRLEELTAANGISHADAHDALSDVLATIALAKLIKDRQPRLYEFVYQLRDKNKVQSQLDIISKKPVLHVSSMYPASRGSLALVAPLTRHPTDKNGVIVYDLRVDPTDWMNLSVEEIQRRLFTRQDDLEEGETRIPLKVLHINRCPVVVGSNLLDDSLARRYEIDLVKARQYWQMLVDNPQATASVASAFDRDFEPAAGKVTPPDPDFMIYDGGFFGAADKKAMQQIRGSSPVELAEWRQSFTDRRLDEMLFRYRARNFPEFLTADERARWSTFCQQRLHRPQDERGAGVSLQELQNELSRLRELHPTEDKRRLLDELEAYALGLSQIR
ncbi:MAG: exodeoxyribonuclease I [Gammaproteobacteria bacterium]|nr:exodeoxyribonuclease I [Gammaproteobacteria bacterium]